MKEFTKEDLRTGDIVVTKNKGNAILIADRFKRSNHIFLPQVGLTGSSNYNDNLKDEEFDDYTIQKVYRITSGYGYSLDQIIDELPKDNVELIWERKREIDWRKVPKFTRVQVKDNNDCLWKNRRFIKFIDGQENRYPYVVTECDQFTYAAKNNIGYQQIKIFDESEIKEEWYK